MRAVFIGCVESSRRTLKALLAIRILEIVGIVTKQKSGFNSDFCSLVEIAEREQIPYFIDVNNNKESLEDWLRSLNVEVIFCIGWPYLLSKNVLNVAAKGVIGYHPTDLPRNRGRHPIIWTLALGLKQSASTFFVMNEMPDAGPIVDKKLVFVGPEDNASMLYERLMQAAEIQIVQIARRIVSNTLVLEPQDLSKGNVWRRRSKQDGLIDWRMSSLGIHNLVRALDKPYPGAYSFFNGSEVKIWRVRLATCDEEYLEPGKVLDVHGNCIVVKSGDAAIEIVEHEFPSLPVIGDYL